MLWLLRLGHRTSPVPFVTFIQCFHDNIAVLFIELELSHAGVEVISLLSSEWIDLEWGNASRRRACLPCQRNTTWLRPGETSPNQQEFGLHVLLVT